jgi:hypothetical protein
MRELSFLLHRVLPSSEQPCNIISDSEEEIIEDQRNNNPETQRTVSIIYTCWKLSQESMEFQ